MCGRQIQPDDPEKEIDFFEIPCRQDSCELMMFCEECIKHICSWYIERSTL